MWKYNRIIFAFAFALIGLCALAQVSFTAQAPRQVVQGSKFDIKFIDRSDIIPLTDLAAEVTGLDTYEDIYVRELEKI